MKKLILEQGSQEWLDARLNHFCASEAAAMMGASKWQSRNQLMAAKKGVKEEITPAKQAIFDKGHESERLARNLLEIEQLITFDACVFSKDVEGLPLLASLDGLTEDGKIIFEHKLWNETLAENVRFKVLEPSHYWQLEHQLLVSGASEVLFMVSDGTHQKREAMTYKSVPARRCDLIDGWKQFQKDLAVFEIEAKKEVVEAEKTTLPALTYSVTGTEINTNISLCLESAKTLAEVEINRSLETDQDFANKDQLNKDVKKARAALKQTIQSVRGEFVSYAQFEEIANELDKVFQKLQSDGEKKVKAAKEAKKQEIKDKGERELIEFCKSITEQVSGIYYINIVRQLINIPFAQKDLDSAMKNKRTIESLVNAVDSHVAEIKVKIESALGDTFENIDFLKEVENFEKYTYLFQDILEIIALKSEIFQTTVSSRIDKVLQEEKAEKARIAEEAAAKAKAEAEAEAEQKAEEEREKIRKEEQEKAAKEVSEPRKVTFKGVDGDQDVDLIVQTAHAADVALLDSGERRAVGHVNTLDVREYATNIALENGEVDIDDDVLLEIICDSPIVWKSPDIKMHRWYGRRRLVADLEGVFIEFYGYIITGDKGMEDHDLKYSLDDFKVVQQKQRTIVETYYE